MEYHVPEYVEFARLDEHRAVLSGPGTRKVLKGESVPLVATAMPILRRGATTDELAAELDEPLSAVKKLLNILDRAGGVSDGSKVDDPWVWTEETAAATTDQIRSATVGVYEDINKSLTLSEDLATINYTDIDAVADEAGELDCLATLVVGERPNFHHRVQDSVTTADLPWLPARAADGEIRLGPLLIPGRTACYSCYYEREVGSDRHPESAVVEKRVRESTGNYPPYPTAAYRLLAATIEVELLTYIGDYGTPATNNGLITVNALTGERARSRVHRVPNCNGCVSN